MPFLEITHFTGDVERRELSKQTPVTIGSHASNDIRIDEDDVEIMHCRISWGKEGFEAIAAGFAPLDVNGTSMQQTLLSAGDVLRFGSVDIRYREGDDDGADVRTADADQGELGLKPITGEFHLESPILKPHAGKPVPPPAAAPRKKPKDKERVPSDGDGESRKAGPDLDAFSSALDALVKESMAEMPVARSQKKPPKQKEPRAPSQAKTSEPSTAPSGPPPIPSGLEPGSEPTAADDAMSDRVRSALRSQQRRPGEEDPLRSPLVLSLTGIAAALLLIGAIFYFIATRQTTQQAFDAAKAYYDEGNYRGGIEALQEFLVAYPKDPLAVQARQLLGLSRVRQDIDSASPRFGPGLEQLRAFIDEQKDLDEFETLHPEIMTHAKTIALGAAVAAGKQFDLGLLEISRQARTILRTYAPKDAPPTETLEQIEQALRASEAAILKDDVYKQHLAAIDEALTKTDPLKALELRRDLLVRYPTFERDKKVVERMLKTLETERSRVTAEEIDQPAEKADHAWPAEVLTLAFQGRTRTDEVAVGKAIVVLAQDCCYGLEFVTGQPLWRRVIGFNTPFFPLFEGDLPSVILFDTNFQELVRLNQNTGELIWRQPIGEAVSGQPLLTNDAIYLPTLSGRLLSVDVVTGRLNGALKFSQPVSGPVEINDGQRMVVAGNQEVIYTLTKRPFACDGVYDLGHPPQSIQAPLLSMASYLLLIENGNNRATLHLLQTGSADQPLVEAATGRVTGRVMDMPVIRGRDLFIPSLGERVSAFSLSDDPGQPPLTAGPVYVGKDRQGPTFLLTGPDRQLWMVTGALSRLRLTTDALQPDGDSVAAGLATQPLKYDSGYLFNARRRPYTSAVTITRTDRDELTSDWQGMVGGRVLALSSTGGGTLNLAAVNDAGLAFRIGNKQFSDGKFLATPTTRLPLHQDLTEPLQAGPVSNNRLAVASGGPEPRMWILNAAGQTEASPQLPQPPQAAPCPLGNDVLVPVAGRIHIVRPSGRSPAQDFALPSGESRTWLSVSPISATQAVAVTTDGVLILLRLNESPRPHLGEVARIELGERVVHPGTAADGLFSIAEGTRKVTVFEGERLEPRGSREFPKTVTNRPLIAGGKVFVEEGQAQLHCLEAGGELPIAWSLELPKTSVVGILQQEEQYYVALQNGSILVVNPADGKVIRQQETLNSLALGPVFAGGGVYVISTDGTVIKLP